jgi:hypothetical protein
MISVMSRGPKRVCLEPMDHNQGAYWRPAETPPAFGAEPNRSVRETSTCREVDHRRATDGQHHSQNQPTPVNDDTR